MNSKCQQNIQSKVCNKSNCCLQTNSILKDEDYVYFQGNLSRKKDSNGWDVEVEQQSIIPAYGIQIVETNVFLEILNENISAWVCSRSGLASKGIFVANSPGIVDHNFTGNLKIILYNSTSTDFVINSGDRIAQILFVKNVNNTNIIRVEHVTQRTTQRGEGCLGSSDSEEVK